jgi:histidinol dehydrogenase
MKILSTSSREFRSLEKLFNRTYEPPGKVAGIVSDIVASVRSQGDAAVIDLTEKFGGPRLTPAALRVKDREIAAATKGIDGTTASAIRSAHNNIRAFAKCGLRKNWQGRNAQGALVGERFDPFRRVGIYVPGGTAPLASTGLMTVTYAAVAGVPEIVVATPCGPDGRLNDALLAALGLAGATEIYKIGGAQAIAAMAFGTRTIRPVNKIFGPGNSFVVEAKRQVFGQVAVDLLPGPSEIFVICDTSANPAWVASDLLAQAEHGGDSVAVVASPSLDMLTRIEKQVHAQAATLSRQKQLLKAIDKNLWLLHCASLDEATVLANEFAPEHLSIVTRMNDRIAAAIETAGAIFLGAYSPVAAGDFMAGPSHELPTGGAGKGFAGLTTDQFQRRTSVVRFDEKSLGRSVRTIETFSALEGLDAHGRSARIRVGNGPASVVRKQRSRRK